MRPPSSTRYDGNPPARVPLRVAGGRVRVGGCVVAARDVALRRAHAEAATSRCVGLLGGWRLRGRGRRLCRRSGGLRRRRCALYPRGRPVPWSRLHLVFHLADILEPEVAAFLARVSDLPVSIGALVSLRRECA